MSQFTSRFQIRQERCRQVCGARAALLFYQKPAGSQTAHSQQKAHTLAHIRARARARAVQWSLTAIP